MTDAHGIQPQERSDLRVRTPRSAPKSFGAANFTKTDLSAWQRFWREVAGDSRRDACQLCCGIGHQASNCETFIAFMSKGRLFAIEQKAQDEEEEREAGVKLVEANKVIAAQERDEYRGVASVGMVLGCALLFWEFVWPMLFVEAGIRYVLAAIIMLFGFYLSWRLEH